MKAIVALIVFGRRTPPGSNTPHARHVLVVVKLQIERLTAVGTRSGGCLEA
jgi:hypothetical protein